MRLFIILLLIMVTPSLSYAQGISENGVKALYVLKFTKFIRWDTNTTNRTVCTIGDSEDHKDSVTSNMTQVVTTRKLENKFTIVNKKALSDFDQCDFLFISSSYSGDIRDILLVASKHKTITLSDIKGFTNKGGVFGFYRDKEKKIKVELNIKNIRSIDKSVNASLLEMIKVVD